MAKLALTDTSKQKKTVENPNDNDDDEGYDLDVDPSHTFSDLSYFALQLNDAALSTHLLAVDMRNWFHKRSMPEHYQVTRQIADALLLRRVKAVIIECQAADQCERKRPGASTLDEKKRLRKLFAEAEDGLG